jgi:hypothetical protein
MNPARYNAILPLEPYQGWAQYGGLREKNTEVAYYNLDGIRFMKSHPQWCGAKGNLRKPTTVANTKTSSGAAHADLPDWPLQLSAPARRALAREGLTTLAALTQLTKSELMALHGIGPNAVKTLESALRQKGLTLSSRR